LSNADIPEADFPDDGFDEGEDEQQEQPQQQVAEAPPPAQEAPKKRGRPAKRQAQDNPSLAAAAAEAPRSFTSPPRRAPRAPAKAQSFQMPAGASEVSIKMEPPTQHHNTSNGSNGQDAVTSPLELEMLAQGQGGVEVERIGPGQGPGWRGNKYREEVVALGRVGVFGNSARLFDEIQERAGGGNYRFTGKVNGNPAIITKMLPGAPKSLSPDEEDIREEEREEREGLEAFTRGIDPRMYDPTFQATMPNRSLDGNWSFDNIVHRWKWVGMGPPRGAPPGNGAAPGDRSIYFHKSRENESDDEDIKRENAELRRKLEIEPLKDKIEQLLQAPKQQQQDPFAGLANMMQMQMQRAEAEQKARAEEERRRWDRDREEQKNRSEREDRERKAETERRDREREDERKRREDERKEERARRDEEQRRREQERREDMERESRRREDEVKRQDKFFEMTFAANKTKSMESQMKEILGVATAVKNLMGGERSELADVKELIQAGGDVFSGNIVPAIAETVAAFRGMGPGVMPQAPIQTIQAQVVPQPAPPPRPQGLSPNMPIDLPHTPTGAQPQAPVQTPPPPPPPAAQEAPAQPVAQGVVEPSPADKVTNEQWAKVLDWLAKAKKAGNTPRAAYGAFQAFCASAGTDYEGVRIKIVGTTAEDLFNYLKRVEPFAGPFKPAVTAARELLSEPEGQDWFEEFADLVDGAVQ